MAYRAAQKNGRREKFVTATRPLVDASDKAIYPAALLSVKDDMELLKQETAEWRCTLNSPISGDRKMITITFRPVSSATLSMQIGDSPRLERSELHWKVESHVPVTFEDGGSLDGIGCGLGVRVGEALDGKMFRDTCAYAHGYLKWVRRRDPCLILLHVFTATFASMRDMAERGHLPSVHLTFEDDQGIKWDLSPDDDKMIWQNSKFKLVPIHEIKFVYRLAEEHKLSR